MAAVDLSGTDEERAEAALIAAAGKILRSGNRDVPEDFVAALFAHAVPEDLMRYDPRQLAELAADAWALLAMRNQACRTSGSTRPPWRVTSGCVSIPCSKS